MNFIFHFFFKTPEFWYGCEPINSGEKEWHPRMWKKIQKKISIFFSQFFFQNPWILVWSRTNSGEKELHSRMWKKIQKKNFKIFFFKIFFSIFFQNFFSIFFSKPLNFGMVANQFRWKKTPSVVTVGLCWNKPAITPKWFNSLDTNSRISCKFHV